MTSRVPLPPALGGGPFRVSAAIKLGVSRSRLAGRDVSAPLWGIRSVVMPSPDSGHPSLSDTVALCQALALRMPPLAFFSHVTAAQLIGVPLPSRLESALPAHVGIAAPHRAMDARDVVGHRFTLRPGDLVKWRGFRMTSPARTWLDLAPLLSLPELVVVGDFLVSRRHPLVTLDALADAVSHCAGRRGSVTLRVALPLLRTGSESPRETLMRLIIVFAGLPEPSCNLNIYASDGRFLARADLAYPDFKLMLEYHGDQHRTDKFQWRRDVQRVGDIEDEGWQMLQFTSDDLAHPEALIARVERRLRARGGTGRRLSPR